MNVASGYNARMILWSLVAFASTLLGGFFALHFKDRLHLILGFAAGVILSLIAFDILPEIFNLAEKNGVAPAVPMAALVGAFLLFHILERGLLIHHSHEEEYGPHKHPVVGQASALALIGHSFLDGVGIGLGFQVSPEIGIVVAIAVIAHDFTDGLNTVSLLLTHKNSPARSIGFLLADAVAPVLGAISTLFFTLGENHLLIYLGFFAGFLLHISAADILPEAHSQHSSWKTILATITGVLLMCAVSFALAH